MLANAVGKTNLRREDQNGGGQSGKGTLGMVGDDLRQRPYRPSPKQDRPLLRIDACRKLV